MHEPSPHLTITYHGNKEPDAQRGTTLMDVDVSTVMATRDTVLEMGEVIGEGGMGVVHRARQLLPGRDVAVKKLRTPDKRLANILLNEAVTMGSLEHPNIVPVHLVRIDEDNSPEVVMKHVQGRSLYEMFAGRYVRGEALRSQLEVVISVCRALEFAHANGVVHRDVKTENIMVGAFGETYLLDWGIAIRLDEVETVPKGVVGTPACMAPEMLSGEPTDITRLTDVYLLGTVLHELLTGEPRHDAPSTLGAMTQANLSLPYEYPEDVPTDLAALTNQACAQSPADRPRSIEAFRLGLERHLERWEALKIRDLAVAKKAALEALVKKAPTSEATAHHHAVRRLFTESLFGFTQAEHLVAGCPGIQQGVQEVTTIFFRWCLEQELVGECEVLLDTLPSKSPALVAELDALKARKAKEARRVDRLERFGASYMREPSRKGRMILALSVSAATTLLVLGVVIYDSLYPSPIHPERLMYTMGGLSLATILGTFLGRKTLFANRIGEHLTNSVVLGTVCAALLAVAGHQLGASGRAVMVGEMLICCMAMANAYPVIASGRWGAAFCGVMVVMSLLIPRATHSALMACGLVSAGLLSFDWLSRDGLGRGLGDLESDPDKPTE